MEADCPLGRQLERCRKTPRSVGPYHHVKAVVFSKIQEETDLPTLIRRVP